MNQLLVKDFIEKAFQFKGMQITWKYSGLREEGIDQNGIDFDDGKSLLNDFITAE